MNESLKGKAVKGLAWNTINTLTNRVVTFVIGIVLARLLSPTDYGLTAMIAVFTAILCLFTDGGLTAALVRKEDRTETDLSTVFWYNLFACWIVYGLIFVMAPYIAAFYDMPILVSITRITTLGMLITPFASIQSLILTTRIDFKTPAIIGVSCNIISGIVGICLAYYGYGVWALVIMGLTSTIIGVIVRCAIVQWYPKTGFSKESFKELFGFSSKMLASQIVWQIYAQIAPLVIGKYYSPAQLGSYNRAKGWAELPSNTFFSTLYAVAFPVLSKLQDDNMVLQKCYRKFIRMSAFCSFPIMIGLSSIASPLTLYVLTEKWSNSIPLLQIICFSFIWLPINALNQSLLLVKGRSDWYFKLSVWANCIGLAAMCCSLPFGLKVFCIGQVCASLLNIFVNTYYTGKLLSLGFITQIKDYSPIFLNSCMMGLICLLAQMPFENNGVKLLVAIPVGAIYYLVSSYFFYREDMMETVALVKNMRGK